MVLLAHIREQHRLCLQSYGRPRMTEELKEIGLGVAIRALDMAVALRRPPRVGTYHSDRGKQYCSHDYQKCLRQHGFKTSMSGNGNCYDCSDGNLLQNYQSRTNLATHMAHAPRRGTGDF